MTRTTELVTTPLHQGHGLVNLIVLLALVALFAADALGVLFVVRRTRRLSRAGRLLMGVVAIWTALGGIGVFVQELRPAGDWWGATVSTAFIVLYGLVACAVVFLVEAALRHARRPRSIGV